LCLPEKNKTFFVFGLGIFPWVQTQPGYEKPGHQKTEDSFNNGVAAELSIAPKGPPRALGVANGWAPGGRTGPGCAGRGPGPQGEKAPVPPPRKTGAALKKKNSIRVSNDRPPSAPGRKEKERRAAPEQNLAEGGPALSWPFPGPPSALSHGGAAPTKQCGRAPALFAGAPQLFLLRAFSPPSRGNPKPKPGVPRPGAAPVQTKKTSRGGPGVPRP